MLNGSCLCGRVTYQITGPLTDALNCHCAMCRKSHGAAFRSRATVQAKDFAWTKGENHVTWYCSSPGNYRGFCEACGTPLLSRFDQTPDIYGLPLTLRFLRRIRDERRFPSLDALRTQLLLDRDACSR